MNQNQDDLNRGSNGDLYRDLNRIGFTILIKIKFVFAKIMKTMSYLPFVCLMLFMVLFYILNQEIVKQKRFISG